MDFLSLYPSENFNIRHRSGQSSSRVEQETPQMTEGRDPKSDLHPHDFLVSFQDLVSDLHHGPEREIGLLEGNHSLVNVAGLAELNACDGLVGVILKLIDLGDSL